MDNLVIFTSDIDIMYQVLNGMVFVFGINSSFWGVLAACSMIGLMIGVIKKMSDPKEQPIFKWVLSLIFVFTLSLTPIDVQIEAFEPVQSIAARSLNDVPALVAVPIWIFSNIRKDITDQFLNAFATVDHTNINNPVDAFAALRHVDVAVLASENVGAYKSLTNYLIDCYSRDQSTASSTDNKQFDIAKVKADLVFSKIHVGYTGWTTTTFDTEGTTATERTCPEAHTYIDNKWMKDSGNDNTFNYALTETMSGYDGTDIERAFDLLQSAGLSQHSLMTSMFLKGVKDKVDSGLSAVELQYDLNEFQAQKKQNSSDMFQYIFSSRNTKMFIMFLEILTVLVTPVLIVFTLLTNNLSILVFGGMYSLIPLVTTIMYIPIKILMAHFFVQTSGVAEPTSWVQIGSTINDAESAVASASALVLMVPALITMLVNKVFVGASSAASALSAANRNEADTSHVSPKINSAPDAGKYSMGNFSAAADASSYNSFMAGSQTHSIGSGSQLFEASTGNNITAIQADSATASQGFQAMQTAAYQTNSQNLLNNMIDFAKTGGSKQSYSAGESEILQGLESLAQDYNSRNQVGIQAAREHVASEYTKTSMGLGAKAEGGIGITAHIKGDHARGHDAQTAEKDTKTEAQTNTTSQSQSTALNEQEQAQLSSLVEKSKSAAETDRTTDSNAISNIVSTGEQLQEIQAQQNQLNESFQNAISNASNYKMDSENVGRRFNDTGTSVESFFSGLDEKTRSGLEEQLRETGNMTQNQTLDDYVANQESQIRAEYANSPILNAAEKSGNAEGMIASKIVNDMVNDIMSDSNPTLADAKKEAEVLSNLTGAIGGISGDAMFNEMSSLFEKVADLNNSAENLSAELGIKPTETKGGPKENDGPQTMDELAAIVTRNEQVQEEKAAKIQSDVNAQQYSNDDINARNDANIDKVEQGAEQSKQEQKLTADANAYQVDEEKVFEASMSKQLNESKAVNGDADVQAHNQDINQGLSFMANNSESQVIDALRAGLSPSATSEQRELATDILAAVGAEGQQFFKEADGATSQAHTNAQNNMNAVSDYINDNQHDVLKNENGLSALLSNNGEDSIDKWEERAINKAEDGDRIWTPQQANDLASAREAARDYINDLNNPPLEDSPLQRPDTEEPSIFNMSEGSNVPSPLLSSVDNADNSNALPFAGAYTQDVSESSFAFMQPDEAPQPRDNTMHFGAGTVGVDNAANVGFDLVAGKILEELNDIDAGSVASEAKTANSNNPESSGTADVVATTTNLDTMMQQLTPSIGGKVAATLSDMAEHAGDLNALGTVSALINTDYKGDQMREDRTAAVDVAKAILSGDSNDINTQMHKLEDHNVSGELEFIATALEENGFRDEADKLGAYINK